MAYNGNMAGPQGEFIAHVDAESLHQLHWPILQMLAPGYVAHFELTHYLDRLLATGDWLSVRAVPYQVDGAPNDTARHGFDIYGRRFV